MGERNRLGAVLEAMGRGSLPAEAALRAALEGRVRFEAWVRRNQPAWGSQAERRACLRRPRTVGAPVVRAALRQARRAYGRAGISSVHWGLERREGRSTGVPAVVVTVPRKLPRALVPADRWIERWLEVPAGPRRARIRVDVQAVGQAGALQLGVQPANHASVRVGNATGALGAIVEEGGGYGAVLSGHVARKVGARVTATSMEGIVLELGRVTQLAGEAADAALAGPIGPDDVAALGSPPVEVRDLGESDLNVALFVVVAREAGHLKTFVTDVDASVPFRYPDGDRIVAGLVGTSHAVTEPGDSGAPAVDSFGRLVGFVVGVYAGRTYLVPARRALENFTA